MALPVQPPIKCLQSFDLDNISGDIYNDKMMLVLAHYPLFEEDDRFRRVKKESDITHESDKYFYLQFIKTKEPTPTQSLAIPAAARSKIRGLYSYMSNYLLAVEDEECIYVLDKNSFKVPLELIEKEIVYVDCGLGYSSIPMDVPYSYHLICEAIHVLDGGRMEDLHWWKQAISRLIGITSESLRFPHMRTNVMQTMDQSGFAYYVHSTSVKWLFRNWSSISKGIHVRRPKFKFDDRSYSMDEMEHVISLINQKDGTKAEKDIRRPSPGLPGSPKVIDIPAQGTTSLDISGWNPPKSFGLINCIAPEDSGPRPLVHSSYPATHSLFSTMAKFTMQPPNP